MVLSRGLLVSRLRLLVVVGVSVVCSTESIQNDGVLGSQRLVRREHEAAISKRETDAEIHLDTSGHALNRNLQSLSEKLEPGPTRDFLETLHLCVPCKHYERFGETSNDGYVMCTDDLAQGLVAAYSYGIDGHDGWGMAAASRYHIPLHEYDCINSEAPEPCAGCKVTFHSECLLNPTGRAPGQHYKTLAQHMTDRNHAQLKDGSLLLKIDIDSGIEWNVMAEEPVAFLRKFRQIVVVYRHTDESKNHNLYAQAGKNLEAAGFSVAHLHGNNLKSGVQSFGEFQLPKNIEVTYVQKPARGCSVGLPYHLPQDVRSDVNAAELADAILPRKGAAAAKASYHNGVAWAARKHTTTMEPEDAPLPAGLHTGGHEA